MEGLELNSNVKTKFLKQVYFTDYCWVWKQVLTQGGYGCLKINGKSYAAHRLSFYIHKGKIPNNVFVCHTCDNKWCVNPDHLWLGTRKDNVQDAVRKGLWNAKIIHTKLR